MQRLRAAAMIAVVVGATAGLALSASAGETQPQPLPITFRIQKVVSGPAAQDFTASVECSVVGVGQIGATDGFAPTVLTFGPDGAPKTADPADGWQIVSGRWELTSTVFVGDTCSVTETGTGGAASVTYSCEWALGESPDGVFGAGCPGAASGPSPSPATVKFEPFGSDTALVTITNTFPAVAAIEVAPVLTG